MKNKITFTNNSDYINHINDCLDFNIPLILVGSPGTAKSETLRSVFDARGSVYHVAASQTCKLSQFFGMLFVNREDKTFEPFYYEYSKVLFEADTETVFQFEDLLLADESLAKGLMSLIRLREIHGRKISDQIKFVFDSNDNSHGAGRGTINTALNNRCSIVQAPIDVNAWLKWGMSSGRIAREILLFIHANPEFAYVENLPKGTFTAFNTFRSWELLTPFVKRGRKNLAVVESVIGNADDVAAEFINFWESLDTYGNLIAGVKSDPLSAPMFGEHEANKILGCVFILSNHFEKDNVDKFITYINRYNNSEYTRLLIELGVQVHPDSKETRAYVSHVTTKGGK
jgi:hypothetical protein